MQVTSENPIDVLIVVMAQWWWLLACVRWDREKRGVSIEFFDYLMDEQKVFKIHDFW